MSQEQKAEYRFVELRADNFMRLRAVAIRPGNQVVEITGANGHGKTSVLRAFWAAIAGRAAAPDVAIRKGADEATLHLDLGGLKVSRTITRNEDGAEQWSIRLEVAGGRRITSRPQAMLDAIVGEGLTLDPMEFARWDAKKQFDALKRLVPKFDFDDNATRRLVCFAQRTDVNRDAKRARAAADAMILPPGPEPEDVDGMSLLGELNDANERNLQRKMKVMARDLALKEADTKRDEAERLRSRAATLDKEADVLEKQLKEAPPIPEFVDIADVQARLGGVEAIKAARALFQNRREYENSAKYSEAESERLSGMIEALDKAKADALAKAKLPVKGLALGDGEILLNGLPFAQASTAEKIRASMAIAMATAGDLKVVMVDEGSELDSKSLAVIEDMVEGTTFVVMICKVDETGSRGWVIEDGAITHVPGDRKKVTK